MIVTIAARLDYRLQGAVTILLQIEAAAQPDQRILEARLDVERPEHLARVPAEDGVGTRCWTCVRDRFACSYAARVEIDRPVEDLRALPQTPVHALPGEAVKYLMGSRFIPSERFGGFVEGAFGALSGGERIAAMRDWIERSLAYVPGASDAGTTAIDTFVSRQGVCRDYAHLMICLARASQIPARMVSVYGAGVEPPDFHAVAEVYLDGGWRLVDATGMAAADQIVRIGVGRDAADISFMTVFGAAEMVEQSVEVTCD